MKPTKAGECCRTTLNQEQRKTWQWQILLWFPTSNFWGPVQIQFFQQSFGQFCLVGWVCPITYFLSLVANISCIQQFKHLFVLWVHSLVEASLITELTNTNIGQKGVGWKYKLNPMGAQEKRWLITTKWIRKCFMEIVFAPGLSGQVATGRMEKHIPRGRNQIGQGQAENVQGRRNSDHWGSWMLCSGIWTSFCTQWGREPNESF